MALVDEHQKVLGEIIQQCGGGRAGGAALDHPGIVFNAAAEADLGEHFQIVGRALGNPLGLDELVLGPEEGHLVIALPLNFQHGPLQLFPGCHVVAGGIDGHMLHKPLRDAGHGVDLADPVDLIPEKLHPDSPSRPVGRVDFQSVSPEAELVSGKVQVISLVADLCQLFEHLVQRVLLSHPQGDHHALIVDGVAQAVQAADGADHNHIPPLEQC